MAVAAYASLVSLTHVLDNVLQRWLFQPLHLNRDQITYLKENIYSLIEFLDVHSSEDNQELQGFARTISSLTFQAEDIIDSYVVTQLQRRSLNSHLTSSLYKHIDRVIQNLVSIKKDLSMAHVVPRLVKLGKRPEEPARTGSSTTFFADKDLKVGLDEHVNKIICMLTSERTDLQIIPIIGMGGIGKTTLAKAVFDDPYTITRFDRRLWVTVSQCHNNHKILSSLLNDGENTEDVDVVILGEKLYKEIFNRRYLIIMDDMWSINAWDDLKRWLPNNKNQSRIVITTRLSSLCNSSSSCNTYFMSFLDDHSSWRLFCHTIFGKYCCPYPELEKVGQKIAKSCRGLPIEIAVIGRLLSKSNMTLEYWKHVAENVNSFGNLGDEEHCLNMLYLSYNNLPLHLKLCYLHMRHFPEDDDIKVSQIIEELVNEGFIKETGDQSLEDIAYGYLKELVDRNMIFAREITSRGRIKVVGIHDLLQDLCRKEFEKEHFLCFPKEQRVDILLRRGTCCLCGCLAFLEEGMVNVPANVFTSNSTLHGSALMCVRCKMRYAYIRRPRMVEGMCPRYFHPTTLREIRLHVFHSCFEPFPTFHLLWNLQTIHIFGARVLPSEVWEMPQLRHIYAAQCILPDPTGKEFVVLKNIQSLDIESLNCSEEIMERISNLKKLKLLVLNTSSSNLSKLKKLELLLCPSRSSNRKMFFSKQHIDLSLPDSLRKLRLSYCRIPWVDMGFIGSLPSLEVLALGYESFIGRQWNPIEGQFLQLKILFLVEVDLECWEADYIHFPNLVKLYFYFLHSLQEIPSGIGDIPTLQTITVNWCHKSLEDSVKEISKEQYSLGNDNLQVVIDDKEYKIDDDDDSDSNGSGDSDNDD